jgi:LysM repeat protein
MKNLFVLLFFIPLFAHAQTTHTVAPKESLYSLGRQYNIHPKELAAYNNISLETGLTIGQVIKIPGKGKMTPVKKTSTVKEEIPVKKSETIVETSSVPVYHKVGKKETLYHISKSYPNLTVEDIKKWNHLTGDGVSEGTNLIVGYQKGKKGAYVSPVVVTEKETPEPKVVVTEPKKTIPVKEQPEAKPVVVMEPKVTAKPVEPVKEQPVKNTGKNFNGGFFRNIYNDQSQNKTVVEQTGTAGIFKSTSGWEDGKYYCLHNTAPAGSIVKITNKSNQKAVYAKVLDVIPDLKQNAGIMIRLSNAAADELGAGENNFEAVLNY